MDKNGGDWVFSLAKFYIHVHGFVRYFSLPNPNEFVLVLASKRNAPLLAELFIWDLIWSPPGTDNHLISSI